MRWLTNPNHGCWRLLCHILELVWICYSSSNQSSLYHQVIFQHHPSSLPIRLKFSLEWSSILEHIVRCFLVTCPFFNPHLTTLHSKYRWPSKISNRIRFVCLKNATSMYWFLIKQLFSCVTINGRVVLFQLPTRCYTCKALPIVQSSSWFSKSSYIDFDYIMRYSGCYNTKIHLYSKLNRIELNWPLPLSIAPPML